MKIIGDVDGLQAKLFKDSGPKRQMKLQIWGRYPDDLKHKRNKKSLLV